MPEIFLNVLFSKMNKSFGVKNGLTTRESNISKLTHFILSLQIAFFIFSNPEFHGVTMLAKKVSFFIFLLDAQNSSSSLALFLFLF